MSLFIVMIRRSLKLACYLVMALTPLAQASAKLPFEPGDRLEYSLHWSFIKVGKAVLEFEKAQLEPAGDDLLHAIFTVETSGVADKLFKVRDRIESWVDTETGRPILYKKKQREGKTKRDIELHFDWDQQLVRYIRDGVERDPVSITEATYDPLSLILAIANTRFIEGTTTVFDTCDGKKLVYIEIVREKDRKLKTRAGRFEAQHLNVATRELEGAFEKSPDASIEIWLSRETPAIPLKMKSEVIVGSFYGELIKANYAGTQIGN